MSLLACLLVAPQWIEPRPSHTEVGAAVRVVAADDTDRPLVGLEIRVRLPSGESEAVGVTDASGVCKFVPRVPGAHRLAADHQEVTLWAPLYAQEARSRWGSALLWCPIGLGLLVWHASRVRRSRADD